MTESVPTEIHLPSQREMLEAVGHGIQAFAMVEMGLGFLFASMMEPADRTYSVHALHAARHIETKMRIVHAVAECQLSGGGLEKFTNVMGRCKRRSEFRHKLAHWAVGYWPGAETAEQAKRQKVVLLPPPSSPGWAATVWGKESPIHLNQIKEFAAKCNALFLDLVALSNAISQTKSRS